MDADFKRVFIERGGRLRRHHADEVRVRQHRELPLSGSAVGDAPVRDGYVRRLCPSVRAAGYADLYGADGTLSRDGGKYG